MYSSCEAGIAPEATDPRSLTFRRISQLDRAVGALTGDLEQQKAGEVLENKGKAEQRESSRE